MARRWWYFEYGRDRAGRIVTVGREGDLAIYYGYDAVNRLTSELWARKSDHGQIYGFWYDYDSAHNRTKMRREFGAGTEWDSAYFGYAADNSLQKRQTNTPAPTTVNTYFYYDANGALIKQWDQGDADATYFWYGPHKLITALKPPGTLASYFYYDGQLNRYCINNAGVVTYYLWDGLKLLEERKADGNLMARYTHGYAPNADIGTIAEVQRQTPTALYYQYPHMDHRGTVYAVSDAAGAVQLSYTQDAFGREVAPVAGANPAVPNDNVYQTNWKTMEFGGKQYMFSKYRVDDPTTGVFLSRDLLTAMTVSNKYTYCTVDPVNWTDPNGLDNEPANSIVVDTDGNVWWQILYKDDNGTTAYVIHIGKSIGNNSVVLRPEFFLGGEYYVVPIKDTFGTHTEKVPRGKLKRKEREVPTHVDNSLEELVRKFGEFGFAGIGANNKANPRYYETRVKNILQQYYTGGAHRYDDHANEIPNDPFEVQVRGGIKFVAGSILTYASAGSLAAFKTLDIAQTGFQEMVTGVETASATYRIAKAVGANDTVATVIDIGSDIIILFDAGPGADKDYTMKKVRKRYWGPEGAPVRPNPLFPKGIEYVELSHTYIGERSWIGKWIPDAIKNRLWNLNPMWGIEHAMLDPERFAIMPRFWRLLNEARVPNVFARLWGRMPVSHRIIVISGASAAGLEIYRSRKE